MTNVYLNNAKSKDYILEYIRKKLSEDPNNSDFLIKEIGIDETLILILSLMEESEVKYGDKLTLSYVLKFYTEGLNFSEIAWIKDISEDGIRYNIHSLVEGTDLSQLKYIHALNRRKLKDNILMVEVLNRLDTLGFDKACLELGYTELYFKRLCKKLNKLKLQKELAV